ncbi:amidase [Zeaxanthinibacter enoshimensis]|uniref:Amidase n=1 Tax=Zeaxanthinibacter enoshimensis TaxID=392009 RepID=A0A4R6TQ10_9FLAO|nr:amidase [Zeaxanthinibacter enoshimensis]TDQ31471.1 amidase [Zeaxanthinibacter enoshimensis]
MKVTAIPAMTLSLCLLLFNASCNPDTKEESSKNFELPNEVTIQDIHKGYESGSFTVSEVTKFYLDRVNELSFNGPELNAVISLNPDAMDIAASMDDKLKNNKRKGPLFGIPVLLKDNINSADNMPTTAGARAMKESYPGADSPLAAQLKEAGAVILGKANLSEWANFHSRFSSSGWSGLGGQTKNPYDTTRNPCGSSSGSAVAVAANLAVVAIGTETNGSIVCPSNNNGIVGIKPTVGLISRSGIIPISFSQDTGGPMARTVRDAAIILGAMTRVDSTDSKTTQPGRKAYEDYTQFLDPNGIQGKRIGYYTAPLDGYVRMQGVMEKAKEYFESRGGELVPIEEIMPSEARRHSFQVLLYEFKEGLNNYFASLGPDSPVKDLEDLIQQTTADSIEMQYFDHDLLNQAQEKGDLNSREYQEALATMLKLSREEGIDKVMEEQQLDAIIAPTGSPAWKTDLTNGDNFQFSSSSPAAISGYPNITLPMGQLDGLPVGISIFGKPWSEPVLLQIAYDFEQGTGHRMSPELP